MAENISGIQQVAYGHESTWNSTKSITASAGSTTTITAAVSMTDSTLNKYAGAMFQCTSEGAGTDILNSWRQCEAFDPTATPTADTAYFQGDPWAATTAVSDVFSFQFIPRIIEASLQREPKFASRKGYKSDSLYRKFPDLHIRTECGINMTCELGGMGFKAGFDLVQAAPAPSVSTFSVIDGTRFSVGQPILVNNTTDGLVHAVITAISTNAITFTPAMSNPPSSSDEVYGLSQPGEIGNLISGCMGSVLQAGRGDKVASSSSATAFAVTDGTQFAVGGIIGVDVGLGGTVEWTQIQTIATHDITVSPALSAQPSASDTVYNTWTVQPADTGHESFTFQLYKHAIKYVVNGCRGTFSISDVTSDDIAKIAFEFMGGGDSTDTDSSIPSDWVDAYVNYDPPIPVGAYLQIAPATADATSEEFLDASFELGSGISRRLSPSASAGISNVSLTTWDAPKITCQINKETLAGFNPLTAMKADTLQHVRLILGGTPGSTFIIDFREAQTMVVNDSENEDRDYWELEFVACDSRSSATIPPFVVAQG